MFSTPPPLQRKKNFLNISLIKLPYKYVKSSYGNKQACKVLRTFHLTCRGGEWMDGETGQKKQFVSPSGWGETCFQNINH